MPTIEAKVYSGDLGIRLTLYNENVEILPGVHSPSGDWEAYWCHTQGDPEFLFAAPDYMEIMEKALEWFENFN